MAESLDAIRAAILKNRASQSSALVTPERSIYANSKGELVLDGEVIDGTADDLSVVHQATFAA
jgi:hypothetical protein